MTVAVRGQVVSSSSFFFNLSFPTLIPLSGVGTTYFQHVVIMIRQLFLRPAFLT
jgi:hypothetical protein